MKKKILLPALATVFFVVSVVQPSTQRPTEASADEYAVYSTVIANVFATGVSWERGGKLKLFVIRDQTSTERPEDPGSEKSEQDFKQMFPALIDGVLKDYKEKNSTPTKLKDSFHLKIESVLVEKQTIEEIFNGGWNKFYKTYPDSNGLIGVSRVGFSADKKQGLVYIENSCGLLCGAGYYALVEKHVDGWRVVKQEMVWVS